MANIQIFDKMATTYENDSRLKIFNLCLENINKLDITGKLLDFGAGTGNIGLNLSSKFESVDLLDPSVQMQEIIKSKISSLNITNCRVLNTDLETDEYLQNDYDCIVVSQVLLHIPCYEQVLNKLIASLLPGGTLIIFDYVKNDDVTSEIVHNGFNINELRNVLKKYGISHVNDKIIYEDDQALLGSYGQLFMLIASNEN